MNIKLIFSMDGKKIFGAQIVGSDAVDKRIDTIAVTMRLGGTVRDLKTLELAYAPPFSSAKDPVNMAGFVAENVLTGKVAFAAWDADLTADNVIALDVREQAEVEAYSLPKYTHIPLGQLRKRLGELDKDKEIVTFCAIGVRAYNGARVLMENGFKNVKVYPGGTRFYQSMHYKENEVVPMTTAPVSDSGNVTGKPKAATCMRLDCSGMQCPGPIMKVFETMKDLKDGEAIEVSASDPGFARDIGAWTRRTTGISCWGSTEKRPPQRLRGYGSRKQAAALPKARLTAHGRPEQGQDHHRLLRRPGQGDGGLRDRQRRGLAMGSAGDAVLHLLGAQRAPPRE